jgi:hypothetical protein
VHGVGLQAGLGARVGVLIGGEGEATLGDACGSKQGGGWAGGTGEQAGAMIQRCPEDWQ